MPWSNACSLESEPVFSGRRKWDEKEGSSKAAFPPNPEGTAAREGGELGRQKGEGGGAISPQLPGHTPVLYINRALGLRAVRLDMSQQHANPF